MNSHHSALPRNLFRLFIIRCLMLLALGTAIVLSLETLELELNYSLLVSVLGLLTLVNILTWLRLQGHWPVTELEIFAQLLIDVAGISLLMYFSGGASNPFIFYYLVPVCISAATLPLAYTWLVTGLSLTLYTLQLSYYVPLPLLAPDAHTHGDNSNLHVIGMWCNFAISAILITYFVAKMARDLRRQESLLNAAKEDALRDEQVMAVATLAAGTAHELGTPLATMMVLIEEMQQDYAHDPKLQQDLDLLATQSLACRKTLQQLVLKAERDHGAKNVVNLHEFLDRLVERWLVIRPDAVIAIDLNPNLQISSALDQGVEQSILNLLNNAADANPVGVEIQAQIKKDTLFIRILDKGPGISEDIAKEIGKPFISTKRKGLGLGLFLSNATMSRAGGTVNLYNQASGGTLTEVTLPLSPVQESKKVDQLDGTVPNE